MDVENKNLDKADTLPDPSLIEALSCVRNEIIASLELFLSHQKHTIGLMTSMIGVALALVAFSSNNSSGNFEAICITAATIILIAVFPVSLISVSILRRYYKIYASNYIYSAALHIQYLPAKVGNHHWNNDLILSGFFKDTNEIEADGAVDKFIDGKYQIKEAHSWMLYRRLILGMGVFSLIAGSVLGLYALATHKDSSLLESSQIQISTEKISK